MKTIIIHKKNTLILLSVTFILVSIIVLISLFNDAEGYVEKIHDLAEDSLVRAFEKIGDILPDVPSEISYKKPDPTKQQFYNNLERLVHLDLKGAPPKYSKYKELFPLFKELGATGLLIEWEDMFPYSGELEHIAAKNAYRVDEIQQILKLAKENSLMVIPLIQTFGHLEFVLKLEKFSHLRELENSPLSLSPSTDDVYTVLFSMLDQVLKFHTDSKYIHLGCDEVYGMGTGKSKQFMKENNLDKDGLFFKHVIKVANHIRSVRPDVKPIIWDDMLRHISERKLVNSGIGEVVEPMVWWYYPNLGIMNMPVIWKKYGNVFKHVWTASSFKGATGPAQYITNAGYHLKNHLSWVEALNLFGSGDKPLVHFRGTALTGWQRYDHFAALCELLPVAIPSLGICLQTLKYGGFTKKNHDDVGNILKCKRKLTLNLKVDSKQVCNFTGFQIYRGILMYKSLEHITDDNIIKGWLTSHHMKYEFSSSWHLGRVHDMIKSKYKGFKSVELFLKNALENFYDKYTVDEWLESNLRTSVLMYEKLYNSSEHIMKRTHFPRRPLMDSNRGK